MSLTLGIDKARMTVIGVGWNNVNNPDYTLDQYSMVLQNITESLGYDFGDDFNWEGLNELIPVDLTEMMLIDDLNLELTDLGLVYADEWLNTDGLLDGEWTNLETQETITGYPEGLVGTGSVYLPKNTYETIANQIGEVALDGDTLAEYDGDGGSPVRISVVVDPDRIDYADGGTLDFTGIKVGVWKSATANLPFKLSNGTGALQNLIPYDELIFPVTVADYDDDNQYEDTIFTGSAEDVKVVFNGVPYGCADGVTAEAGDNPNEWVINGETYTTQDAIARGYFVKLSDVEGMDGVRKLILNGGDIYKA